MVALDMMTEDGNADHHLTEDAYISLKAIEGIAIHAQHIQHTGSWCPTGRAARSLFFRAPRPTSTEWTTKARTPPPDTESLAPPTTLRHRTPPTSSGGITFGTVG